jgi:nitronate monooxygenase
MLIIGGGISDGSGVAGAIAAGADLVYMGTRFIATPESQAAQEYKQMLVDRTVDDLIVSAGITGTSAIWLKPSIRANGLDPDNLPPVPARSFDSNSTMASKRWKDVWAAGQAVGGIKTVESVADIVDRLEKEYRAATIRLQGLARM